jgi:hypothetical protein
MSNQIKHKKTDDIFPVKSSATKKVSSKTAKKSENLHHDLRGMNFETGSRHLSPSSSRNIQLKKEDAEETKKKPSH